MLLFGPEGFRDNGHIIFPHILNITFIPFNFAPIFIVVHCFPALTKSLNYDILKAWRIKMVDKTIEPEFDPFRASRKALRERRAIEESLALALPVFDAFLEYLETLEVRPDGTLGKRLPS
jgi:hypothetical protein